MKAEVREKLARKIASGIQYAQLRWARWMGMQFNRYPVKLQKQLLIVWACSTGLICAGLIVAGVHHSDVQPSLPKVTALPSVLPTKNRRLDSMHKHRPGKADTLRYLRGRALPKEK